MGSARDSAPDPHGRQEASVRIGGQPLTDRDGARRLTLVPFVRSLTAQKEWAWYETEMERVRRPRWTTR
jgi:hypothetical protein